MWNVYSEIKRERIRFRKIDEACHYIPSGKNVWEGREERLNLEQLRCRRNLNNTKDWNDPWNTWRWKSFY